MLIGMRTPCTLAGLLFLLPVAHVYAVKLSPRDALIAVALELFCGVAVALVAVAVYAAGVRYALKRTRVSGSLNGPVASSGSSASRS